MSRQECNDLIDSACLELVDYCDNLLKDFHERTRAIINAPCTCEEVHFVQKQHTSGTLKKKGPPRPPSCNTCKQWYNAIKNAHVNHTIDTNNTNASQWSRNRFEVLRVFVTGQKAALTSFADADSSVMLCFLQHFRNTPSLIMQSAKTARSQFRNQSAHMSVAGAARPLDIDALTNVLVQLLETAQLPDAARNVRGSSIRMGQHRRHPLPSTRPPSEQLQTGLNSMLGKVARQCEFAGNNIIDAWPTSATSMVGGHEHDIKNIVEELASKVTTRDSDSLIWLSGESGSGKTMTLLSVARKLRDYNDNQVLPIFVELGNLMLTTNTTPAELEQQLIDEFVRNICAECPELSASVRELVQTRVDEHAAVFLCDAFDELHAVLRQPESHDELARLFREWTREYERFVIVTCRNALDQSHSLATSMRLVPMSATSLRDTLEWFFARRVNLPKTDLANLVTFVMEDNLPNARFTPRFVQLVGNYVLRRIDSTVDKVKRVIDPNLVMPRDIPDLLNDYLKDLLSCAHADCLTFLTPNDMLRFITTVGFVLIRDGQRSMDRVDLKAALVDLGVPDVSHSIEFAPVIDSLVRANILVDGWSGSVRVVHRSVCEYLAALYIAESPTDDEMRLALRDSDVWVEVLVQLFQLGRPAVVERLCTLATELLLVRSSTTVVDNDHDRHLMPVDERLAECLLFLNPSKERDRARRWDFWADVKHTQRLSCEPYSLPMKVNTRDDLEDETDQANQNNLEANDAWRQRYVFKHMLVVFSRGLGGHLSPDRRDFGEILLKQALELVEQWSDVESFRTLILGAGAYPLMQRNEVLICALGGESAYLRSIAAKKTCELRLAGDPEIESALSFYAGDVTVEHISNFINVRRKNFNLPYRERFNRPDYEPSPPDGLVRLRSALIMSGHHETDALWHGVDVILSLSWPVFNFLSILPFVFFLCWIWQTVVHCQQHDCVFGFYMFSGFFVFLFAGFAYFGHQSAYSMRTYCHLALVIVFFGVGSVLLAFFWTNISTYPNYRLYSQQEDLGEHTSRPGEVQITYFSPCTDRRSGAHGGMHWYLPLRPAHTPTPSRTYTRVSCCESGNISLLNVNISQRRVTRLFRQSFGTISFLFPNMIWLVGAALSWSLSVNVYGETMRGFVKSRWRWCQSGWVIWMLSFLHMAPLVSWLCRRSARRPMLVPTSTRGRAVGLDDFGAFFVKAMALLVFPIVFLLFCSVALFYESLGLFLCGLVTIVFSAGLSISLTRWMQRRMPLTLDDSFLEGCPCDTLTLLAFHPRGRAAVAGFVVSVAAMVVSVVTAFSPLVLFGDCVFFGLLLFFADLLTGKLAAVWAWSPDDDSTLPVDVKLCELEEVVLRARRLDVCVSYMLTFSDGVTSGRIVVPSNEYARVCALWGKYRQRDPGVATALEDVMVAMVQRKEATWAKSYKEDEEAVVVGELETSTSEGNVNEEEE